MSHLFVFDNRPTVKNARLLLPAGENIPHTLPLRSARNPQPLLSHPLDLITDIRPYALQNASPKGSITLLKNCYEPDLTNPDVDDRTSPTGNLSDTYVRIRWYIDACKDATSGNHHNDTLAKQTLSKTRAEILKTPDAFIGEYFDPTGPKSPLQNIRLTGRDTLRDVFNSSEVYYSISAGAGGDHDGFCNAEVGYVVPIPRLLCAIGLPARTTVTIPFTLKAVYDCTVETDVTTEGIPSGCSPALNLVPNILLLTADGSWQNAPITADTTFSSEDLTPTLDRPLSWTRIELPDLTQATERTLTATGTVTLQIPAGRLFALAILPSDCNPIQWADSHLPTPIHSPAGHWFSEVLRIASASLRLRLELTLHPSRFTLSP